MPAVATAPALILTGLLMCRDIGRIDAARLDTAIPAFLIVILVPLTYSISHGIGAGFVAYVAIKVLNGRIREVHPLMADLRRRLHLSSRSDGARRVNFRASQSRDLASSAFARYFSTPNRNTVCDR